MAELKAVGAFNYSMHPSTRPTCLSFKFNDATTTYLLKFETVYKQWALLPQKVKDLWNFALENDYLFSGHNAFFEICIYKNILVNRLGWPDIPFRRFRCTAAKAAACALPRKLAGAGEAMDLYVQKDPAGYSAMMATCKPTKNYKKWLKITTQTRNPTKKQLEFLEKNPNPPMFLEPDASPEVFETLYHYCKVDVLAEECLDEAVPDLTPEELEIWFFNLKLNWRGIQVDVPVIKKVLSIIETDDKKGREELDALTMGLVSSPGARQSILDFLALEDIILPNLQAKTVDEFLSSGQVTGDMQRLLEIRKALSKTSTKKYQAFLNRSGHDGRIRDILMYHGASTGRDTGTGVQPHNFPRGSIKDTYAAIQDIIECDKEMLRVLWGESLSILFSSVLRGMIIPSNGHELYVADFSKIEVAVLWWLAGNEAGLEILRSGLDPYIVMAAFTFGKRYEDVTEDERQLGKAQVLGCGFQMGWARFQEAAREQYRLTLTEDQSRMAVNAYREKNETVVELWAKYQMAAMKAIEDNEIVEINHCTFFVKNDFLWVKLPSGRPLAYRKPEVIWVETEWGARKQLQYWAVNSKTKKWNTEKSYGGKLTENIVQAVARDLMMPGMLRLEKAGYRGLLMVHDEAITEAPIGQGSVEEFTRILTETPSWGQGLPIEAKGWKGPRYRK